MLPNDTMQKPLSPAAARVSAALVSLYLATVGGWLILSGRIRSPGLWRMLRAGLRAPYTGVISNIQAESGLCYTADTPQHLRSDLESASRLRLFEDGRELGPAHSAHDEVRRLGQGRFSHWGPTLYFSSSDCSDPRSNGRRYEIREST